MKPLTRASSLIWSAAAHRTARPYGVLWPCHSFSSPGPCPGDPAGMACGKNSGGMAAARHIPASQSGVDAALCHRTPKKGTGHKPFARHMAGIPGREI